MTINKRILTSALTIGTAGALLVGATFAFFTSQAVSQNNTFSTGNASLQISNDTSNLPSFYGSEIPAPAINELNIFPGFTKTYKFWLKNNSSAAIKLDLSTTFDDVVTTGTAAIADQLTAQFTCVSDTDSNGSFDTTIATSGTFSINAWDAGSDSLGQLAVNDSTFNGQGADEAQCTMTVNLPGSADNTIANSSVRFDGVFNATQAP